MLHLRDLNLLRLDVLTAQGRTLGDALHAMGLAQSVVGEEVLWLSFQDPAVPLVTQQVVRVEVTVQPASLSAPRQAVHHARRRGRHDATEILTP